MNSRFEKLKPGVRKRDTWPPPPLNFWYLSMDARLCGLALCVYNNINRIGGKVWRSPPCVKIEAKRYIVSLNSCKAPVPEVRLIAEQGRFNAPSKAHPKKGKTPIYIVCQTVRLFSLRVICKNLVYADGLGKCVSNR